MVAKSQNKKIKKIKESNLSIEQNSLIKRVAETHLTDTIDSNGIKDSKLEIMLYDDNKLKSLLTYCEFNNYSYAYILHNQDRWTASDFYDLKSKRTLGTIGDVKKDHYHFLIWSSDVVFNFKNLSIKFDIPYHLFSKVKDLDMAIVYLTHLNRLDKWQYDVADIKSNCLDYCIYLYTNYNQSSNVISSVLTYLGQQDRHNVNATEVIQHLLKSGFTEHKFRAYWHIIKDLILDHNDTYSQARYFTDKYINEKKSRIETSLSNVVETFDDIKEIENI